MTGAFGSAVEAWERGWEAGDPLTWGPGAWGRGLETWEVGRSGGQLWGSVWKGEVLVTGGLFPGAS